VNTGNTAHAPARPRLVAATRSTYVAFISCGFAMASWASRIPQVRDRLHLNSAELGLMLLSIAAGSIAALLLAGIIVSRFHSRPTVTVMAMLQGAALAAVAAGYLVGVAPVVAGLFVFGFSDGRQKMPLPGVCGSSSATSGPRMWQKTNRALRSNLDLLCASSAAPGPSPCHWQGGHAVDKAEGPQPDLGRWIGEP
jgi:MFS family permease